MRLQGHEQTAYELLSNHKDKINSVLNIGIVNLPHKMHEITPCVRLLEKNGINPKITHLEIFQRNCDIGKIKYPTHNFIQGDVRNIKNLVNEKFDLIFWWHGPEHIYEHELIPTISDIETFLNDGGVIILGSPDGWQEQHNDDGNIHNDHYSGPDTDFYKGIGYDVYRVWDDAFWSLVAYKKV